MKYPNIASALFISALFCLPAAPSATAAACGGSDQPIAAEPSCTGASPAIAVAASFSKAKRIGKRGCTKGAFFDPRKGGECWSCPKGYKRTVFPVTAKGACETGPLVKASVAKLRGKFGCRKGSFLDVGSKTCWACPKGWKRTVFPVDGPKACRNG